MLDDITRYLNKKDLISLLCCDQSIYVPNITIIHNKEDIRVNMKYLICSLFNEKINITNMSNLVYLSFCGYDFKGEPIRILRLKSLLFQKNKWTKINV